MGVRFTEEKNNQILHYNNQLAQLQTRLDKAQSEAVHWESKWTHIQNTAAKKTLLLGRIKIATHNLCQLVLRHARRNPDNVGPEDDETPREGESQTSASIEKEKKGSVPIAAAGST